jgi:hypothetical protein
MRKLIVIVLLAFAGSTFAQTPNAAKDNFKTKYPDATNVYWTPSKDDSYKVNYTQKDMKYALVYDKNGNIISEERELQTASVPPTIADYYTKRMGDNKTGTYTVWEVKDKDGTVSYTSEFQGKTAYFDKDGNVTTKKGMATGEEQKPMDDKTPQEKYK